MKKNYKIGQWDTIIYMKEKLELYSEALKYPIKKERTRYDEYGMCTHLIRILEKSQGDIYLIIHKSYELKSQILMNNSKTIKYNIDTKTIDYRSITHYRKKGYETEKCTWTNKKDINYRYYRKQMRKEYKKEYRKKMTI